MNNKGSAVVEAVLTLPIFIFAVLSFYFIGQCKLAEQQIYEAAVETAEYLSEYAYFDKPNILLANCKFTGYADDVFLLDRYIENGVKGVNFIGSDFGDNQLTLKANYCLKINVPLIGDLFSKKSITIKQRYYTGIKKEKDEGEVSSDDEFVYITDNKDVYHSTRACTHLSLSIKMCNLDYAKAKGFSSCERCRGYGAKKVYITDSGEKYHYNANCSGLKRTIYRVKKKEVIGLGGCLRCVK